MIGIRQEVMVRVALALVAALLAAAPAPARVAPPVRVASLSLCTDELALLLAAPGQLASVTWLAADAQETALASRTRGLTLNNGRMESVAALRPDLVLTSGPATRYAAEIAARLGARVVDVPAPATIADIRANVRAVSAALGRPAAAQSVLATFDRDLGPVRVVGKPALLVQGGGYVPAPGSLAAGLLARAGLIQVGTNGGQIDFEQLLIHPPQVIVLLRYRVGQTSRAQSWLAHPALRHLASRRVAIDGRAWTCMGPGAAAALPRLRAALGR